MWYKAALVMIAICGVNQTFGEEPTAATKVNGVLCEVRFGQDGSFIVFPVKIGEASYSFSLGTSNSTTVYDRRLRSEMGAPAGTRTTKGTGIGSRLEVYSPPPAFLGQYRFPQSSVVPVLGLAAILRPAGIDCYGTIGVDAISKSIVEIDFDEEIFRIRETLPENPGDSVSLNIDDRLKIPTAKIKISGLGEQSVSINTTMASEGSFSEDVFDALLKEDHVVRRDRPTVGIGPDGRRFTVPTMCLPRVSIAAHTLADVHFERNRDSMLGLAFLKRFKVVLDFPGKKMYLKPGKRFGIALIRRPFDFAWVDDALMVTAVDEQGAAFVAGLKPYDHIKSVNEIEGKWEKRVELTRELRRDGFPMVIRIQRDGNEQLVKYTSALGK